MGDFFVFWGKKEFGIKLSLDLIQRTTNIFLFDPLAAEDGRQKWLSWMDESRVPAIPLFGDEKSAHH